jgi:hypothetical protein
MDILNWVYLLKNKLVKTTVQDPTQDLVILGGNVTYAKRGDKYQSYGMTVEDFAAEIGSGVSQIVAGTNVTISPTSGLGAVTVNASGLPSWFEYNDATRTFWNNGLGNISTNLSFGEFALDSNTTGYENTAIGNNALPANTTGYRNTALGYDALKLNTTGQGNIAIGHLSLSANTAGFQNTSIGRSSMLFNQTGNYNVALGDSALGLNVSGSHNIAIGQSALTFNTASNNVAIGSSALTANTTGSNNTGIGYGTVSGNFSGSVILGYLATATASNQFVVGSSGTNAGAVTTETITANRTWTVSINGSNYKIPMVLVP